MLKTMRKNVKALAPILWIVIAAFVVAIFAVWGGAGRLGEGTKSSSVATVGRKRISEESYFQALRFRLDAIQKEFQQLNRSFIEQLNIPQQVLEQMIEQILLFQLAKDMGIRASNEEIRDKVMSYPVFQKDGKFIGFEEYKKILAWNHISLSQFEDGLRNEIILNKVIQVLTAGIPLSPDELWEYYKKENQTAKIEYLALEKSKMELEGEPAEAEIRSFFENNRAKYKIPEKREAFYIFLKMDDLKKEIELSESEIEKYYKDNIEQFQIPEKVKVHRVYLPYENKDKSLVSAEAQNILERIHQGEDFAALAQSHSKDSKAKDGGDWGYSEWKTLSPQEQEQIQKLEAGQVSPPITLEEGIAILKATEKSPAVTSPLTEVRGRVKNMLQDQRARDLASERISALERRARKEKNLNATAEKLGYSGRSSGLLKEGQSLGEIDPAGSLSTAIFKLKEGEISSPIYTYGGVGIAELRKVESPRPANFEEVRSDVHTDLIEFKKKEKVLETIKDARTQLTNKSWEDIAHKYNLEYKTVNEHKKDQYLSIVGENPTVDDLVFSLPFHQVSEPVEFENGYALFRVLERKEVTREDLEKDKDAQKDKLLETKKNKFLQSYLAKLREEKGVKIKYDVFLKVTSDILSRYEEEKK
ncbi:MAG: SurA N-terminal domain-containing protein [Candidatus Aminicenantales bacterium]